MGRLLDTESKLDCTKLELSTTPAILCQWIKDQPPEHFFKISSSSVSQMSKKAKSKIKKRLMWLKIDLINFMHILLIEMVWIWFMSC